MTATHRLARIDSVKVGKMTSFVGGGLPAWRFIDATAQRGTAQPTAGREREPRHIKGCDLYVTYERKVVGAAGFEPATPCAQARPWALNVLSRRAVRPQVIGLVWFGGERS